jgi:hypothetical protein
MRIFNRKKRKPNGENYALESEKSIEVLNSDHESGIEAIYNFLQGDFESKGYNDALANPDDSYKSENIKLFKQDLDILIQKVTTKYEDTIREVDFHITSRERAGLIDTVEKLKSKKLTVSNHMSKINDIQKDAELNQGMCLRMILSYQRGFMRGLAALTHTKFFNK